MISQNGLKAFPQGPVELLGPVKLLHLATLSAVYGPTSKSASSKCQRPTEHALREN